MKIKKIYFVILVLLTILILVNSVTAYSINIRTQTGNSCGSTSLAMLLDKYSEPYHSQEWYDICTKRNKNRDNITFVNDMILCGWNMGYYLQKIDSYYVRDIKPHDIVIYHSLGYDNDSDLHASVVENVDYKNKSFILDGKNYNLIIANPWGVYDYWDLKDFQNVYTGVALRLRSTKVNTIVSRDESFIEEIDNQLKVKTYEDNNGCIKLYNNDIDSSPNNKVQHTTQQPKEEPKQNDKPKDKPKEHNKRNKHKHRCY